MPPSHASALLPPHLSAEQHLRLPAELLRLPDQPAAQQDVSKH